MSPSAPLPVLVNPKAGGGFSDGERLAGRFRSAGAEARIQLVHGHDKLVELAKKLAQQRPPLIVAGGGDGTMNALAALLAGSDTALGILPLGTLNHFARDIGIPLEIGAAVDTVVKGKRKAVDLGEVNGRVFVNNSSIGLYPAMVHLRKKQQRRLGRNKWHAMLWAAHAVLRSHPFMQLTLALDGKTYRRRTPFVFIGNNVYEMQGFDIGRRQRLDAGVLSVYVTHRGGRFGLLALAGRALLGRLEQSRDFEAGTAAELRIESRHTRLLVATDGEVAAMDLPLSYRVRPRALRVIAP